MNLYVIGNGFDIDHGIPSSYTDFKKFLVDSEDNNAKALLDIIEISYREKDSMLWKDLEKNIGELDLDYSMGKGGTYIIKTIIFTGF